jgi:hypothetical protein
VFDTCDVLMIAIAIAIAIHIKKEVSLPHPVYALL